MFILNCLEQFNSTFSLSFPAPMIPCEHCVPPPSKFNRKIERKTLQNELERVHSVSGYFARFVKCQHSDRQQWPVLGWVASQDCVSSGLNWTGQKSAELQTPLYILKDKYAETPDTSHDLLLSAIWTNILNLVEVDKCKTVPIST